MAKQGGLLGITGTIGGMTLDKNGVVRQARTSNKATFESADSMARVRENASEFGRAALAGKLFRQALRKQIQGAADKLMVSRLTKAMRTLVGLDATNPRGKRQVLKTHVSELVGFDFNDGAPLTAVFFADYTVVLAAATVTLTITGLVPDVDMAAPTGATHYDLEMGVSVVNFETGTLRVVPVTGIPAAAVLDTAPVPPITLTAALGAALAPNEVLTVVLGVNFYQQINGLLYALKNEGTNPLGVVYCA
jgi:hypothetical protein